MPRHTGSIVVPIYQNESNIADLMDALEEVRTALSSYDIELVFVDDGSLDNSLQLLKENQALHNISTRILKHTRNFGQTAAIQSGLRYSRGDWTVVISADLQEPSQAISEMVNVWEMGESFVIGERISRSEGLIHRFFSGTYWWLIRRMGLKDFPRMGYDFCLLDRCVVNSVTSINETNSSVFVLIYWLGYEPYRIPIARERREKGVSQWSLTAKVMFTLDTIISFSPFPARFITFTSLVSSILAFVYLLFLLASWSSSGNAPPGWMTVVGLLLLFGSLTLFSLGIISEYLLRILNESRRRPNAIIEREIT